MSDEEKHSRKMDGGADINNRYEVRKAFALKRKLLARIWRLKARWLFFNAPADAESSKRWTQE